MKPPPLTNGHSCVDTLRAITYAKFSQNKALEERLRDTKYTDFYECTRDLFWGTGLLLPSTTREIDHTKFEGENQFGLILQDVRAKLQRNANRAASLEKACDK